MPKMNEKEIIWKISDKKLKELGEMNIQQGKLQAQIEEVEFYKKRYMQFDETCLRCLGNEIIWNEIKERIKQLEKK